MFLLLSMHVEFEVGLHNIGEKNDTAEFFLPAILKFTGKDVVALFGENVCIVLEAILSGRASA